MRTQHETESAVHIVLWSLVENVVSYFITQTSQRVVDIYVFAYELIK